MPLQIKSDGTWSQEYIGPYAGLDVQSPAILVADNASPSFNNFMLRNKELRSRPRIIPWSAFNFGNVVLGATTFLDANGTYHACTWADPAAPSTNPAHLFQWNPGTLTWDTVGQASPGQLRGNPVSYRTFANILYYTDVAVISSGPRPGGGGTTSITPFLAFWDGIAGAPVFTQTFSDASVSNSVAGISLTDSPTVGGSLPGGPTVVGPLAIGAAFLGELNNQLILANVSVLDQNNGGAATLYTFPNLIWWSANGLPKQWDPTQNTSAGFNAFLDVPDQITGLMTLGVAGYLYRGNGITQFAPTSSAVTPFQFNHMWASEHGIGNVFPWSIAQYGPQGAFIAQDNIYALSITNAQPIGGTSRDAILADIAASIGPPVANIIPIFKAGYVYLTYQIQIPLTGPFVRQYTYSFEDKNWAPWDLAIAGVSAPPNTV